jgi:2-polyprenyl-3-methyl-5-hydroxy-6-metoxy-1,4-benzoquinol methylase
MSASEPRPTTEGGDACPVCAGRAAPRIDVGDFRLFRCGGCGCWSSDAKVRGAETSFEPESYFANASLDREKWDALADRLQGLPDGGPASLLDVGCGTGAFVAHATARWPGLRAEGIEIDAERAEQARAANPHARIHRGDALEVAAGLEGRFELITLWDVFEHVTEPTRLLGTLGRLLTTGGRLYVQTIHERSLVPAAGRLCYALSGGRLRAPARRTHEPHHLVFFTREGLEHAARASGLQIRDLWFDRLHRGRMDGPPLLTALTSMALRAENALGGGLFVNLLLEPATPLSRQ